MASARMTDYKYYKFIEDTIKYCKITHRVQILTK